MVNLSLSDTLASLSDDDIIALVGPATWANGMRLAASGAVGELTWDDDGSTLEARVKDKGLSYRVRVTAGAVRPSLACACRLRSDCPHTVATLLKAAEELRDTRPSEPEWTRVLRQVLGATRERSGEALALVIDAHDPSVEVGDGRPGSDARLAPA